MLKEVLQTFEKEHCILSQMYRKERSAAEMVNMWANIRDYVLKN